MSHTQEKVGRVVRRLRKKLGYSQEAFAALVGVHRTYMGVVERGEANLTLESLERIAKKLDMTVAELLHQAERDKGASA
jgi:transcriptional regulator with XRE-family HTH domain